MTPVQRSGLPSLALNVVAALVVGIWIDRTQAGAPSWALVLAYASTAAWAVRAAAGMLGAVAVERALLVVSALAGAAAAASADGITIVPVVVAVLVAVGGPEHPPWFGTVLAALASILVAVGGVIEASSVSAIVASIGGVLLAGLGGLSRRQYRAAERQRLELQERELAMREEAARVGLARELHDVLAHSLGGLVLQLDAVEALLEAGDAESAARRVSDARGLAVAGLDEARRAVAALRDPAATTAGPVAGAELAAELEGLVAAHRSLGGTVDFAVRGAAPDSLAGATASAVRRAAQESLSNARKHAPGAPVELALDWHDGRVRLTASTPLADGAPGRLARSGARHGLDGMRERFAALPGGTVAVESGGGRFVVTAEAGLS